MTKASDILPMVEVSGLTKSFSNKNKLRENLRETVTRLLSRRKTSGTDFVAVNNVSFSVAKGEIFGIMGANGSGKSTILKILSKITPPDAGTVVLNGTLTSILEIGTGFHPDLSGRDNIMLTGSLLGISKAVLDQKMQSIAAFSELEDFLDTPVKYYSSGMFIRLAFSIVSELQTDIILLDEVMAVGDASFSLKSLDRIRTLAENGKTIIMVSHDPTVITQLCNRCMILKAGKVLAIGEASETVAKYTEEAVLDRQQRTLSNKTSRTGNQSGQIVSPSLIEQMAVLQDGKELPDYQNNRPLTIRFSLVKSSENKIRIALAFNHQISIPVFSATPSRATQRGDVADNEKPGIYDYELTLPAHFFNQGIYTVDFYLTDERNVLIEKIMQAISFRVKRISENNDPKETFNFLGGYSGPLVQVFDWKAEKRT